MKFTNNSTIKDHFVVKIPIFQFTKIFYIFFIFTASSCVTERPIDLSSFPNEDRTMFLHNFTNQTFTGDIQRELTEVMRSEIIRRGNFRLLPEREKAALGLYGEVTVYRKEGRMYDNYRTPVRWEVIMAVKIRIREMKPKSGPGFSAIKEVSAVVDFSDREGFVESEFEARERLIRRLAMRINQTIEAEYAKYYGGVYN